MTRSNPRPKLGARVVQGLVALGKLHDEVLVPSSQMPGNRD